MASLAIWMTTLTICLAAIILSAAAGLPIIHTTVAALISLTIAAMAVVENWHQRKAGVSENIVAGSTARYMGLVWAWGALGLFATYNFILVWREWLFFTVGFAVIGIVCLLFAAALDRDEKAGRQDATMLNLAKYLSIGQLIGMAIAMIGLVLDGKFPVTVTKNFANQDWAANNMFFFGALGIAIITANALYTKYQRERFNEQNV